MPSAAHRVSRQHRNCPFVRVLVLVRVLVIDIVLVLVIVIVIGSARAADSEVAQEILPQEHDK